ncbi:hypothetical protein A2W14_03285 [Candidatus Gottesmanbacteria bacterium RBG_16_37_8]|uniref:Uncharacterized protein n=1 Tax=Candidatus Gottesmanbacteria bacterium RBG_16_37_8 TaxID=1798371 RepID=A0A1F5YTZ6_9BACT|nr:MAG: hypothetical protein A2W14_03285 [Candidatus Gottesmanbacteria bacterium RBG_16_37_8]
MSEIINEKVSVLSFYDRNKGTALPIKLFWQGRAYKIKQVGYHWPARLGRKLVHNYCVVTENNTSFKLVHDTETLHWTLEEVIDEFAA